MKRLAYGLLSLGWNGSHAHLVALRDDRAWSWPAWPRRWCISVHSIVSMDFATSVLPGWHTTIFPPYFVAGAVFSGFGMVMTLLIVTRKVMHLERYITARHLDRMAKIMLLTGSLVAFSYATEFFTAWYGGNPDERFAFLNRATGPYAWAFWTMVLCNVARAPAAVAAPRARAACPCCS